MLYGGMKVLIIDDDRGIGEGLAAALSRARIVADWMADGAEGARQALVDTYDAVVLDMSLPGKHGLQVAEEIREKKPMLPILVLTVEDVLEQKVQMLALCDDYVTKPFSAAEVIARLHAITRRGAVLHAEVLELADLRMDLRTCRVTRSGREIRLRNREFALLEYFLRHPGAALTRADILTHVWDRNADPLSNTVDVHVRLLRSKLDRRGEPALIHTISGRGYMMSA